MALKPYEEIAAEPLAFPIGGKTYTPPPIGAKSGIYLMRAFTGDPEVAADTSQSLWQVLLGPAYDEMVADDVPLDAIARAGFAALVDWQGDRARAAEVWESGANVEATAALWASIASQSSAPAATSTKPPARSSGSARRRR